MTIGEKIAWARERKGLTLEELAAQLGVTRVAANNWERGENNPTTARLGEISRILDVTVEWLTSDDDSEPAAPPQILNVTNMRWAIIAAEMHWQSRNERKSPVDKANDILKLYDLMAKADDPSKVKLADYPNVFQLFAKR